jgi:hypothetical protein
MMSKTLGRWAVSPFAECAPTGSATRIVAIVAGRIVRPGYLTVTLLGMNGGWAMCPIVSGDGIDLARYRPPLEFETAFIVRDDSVPWNLWWTFNLFDEDGKNLGQGWGPGIQNIPDRGRAFINSFGYDPA